MTLATLVFNSVMISLVYLFLYLSLLEIVGTYNLCNGYDVFSQFVYIVSPILVKHCLWKHRILKIFCTVHLFFYPQEINFMKKHTFFSLKDCFEFFLITLFSSEYLDKITDHRYKANIWVHWAIDIEKPFNIFSSRMIASEIAF